MVNIEELSPGMRIKIVDQWGSLCYQASDGSMDKYLGRVVTVHEVFSDYVLIEEDAEEEFGHHWYWNEYCIDYIVYEDGEDFEVSSTDELFALIVGA